MKVFSSEKPLYVELVALSFPSTLTFAVPASELSEYTDVYSEPDIVPPEGVVIFIVGLHSTEDVIPSVVVLE